MILERPPEAWAIYVLAHGAGAGMRHPFMESFAKALAAGGIADGRQMLAAMAATIIFP